MSLARDLCTVVGRAVGRYRGAIGGGVFGGYSSQWQPNKPKPALSTYEYLEHGGKADSPKPTSFSSCRGNEQVSGHP